jgi:hypothetical protein
MLELRSVQPNPARGGFRVSYATRSGVAASLELLDVAGRRVLRRQVPAGIEGSEAIAASDMAGLPPGIYHLRLVQGAATRQVQVHLLR